MNNNKTTDNISQPLKRMLSIINVYTNLISIRYYTLSSWRAWCTRKMLEIERKYTYKSAIISRLTLQKRKSPKWQLSFFSFFFCKRVVFGFAASDAFRKLNDYNFMILLSIKYNQISSCLHIKILFINIFNIFQSIVSILFIKILSVCCITQIKSDIDDLC